MHGYYEIHGKMGPNNLITGMRGPNYIRFADGHTIRFGHPSFKLGGTVYGERGIETYGSCTFEDITNNRKAVLIMNTFKKTSWVSQAKEGLKDGIAGYIYEPNKEIQENISSN